MSYVFSRRILGGGAESFRFTVEYGNASGSEDGASRAAMLRSMSTLTGVVDRLEYTWSGEEAETAVVERFAQKKSELLIQNLSEHVAVRLNLLESASTFPDAYVHVNLSVVGRTPILRTMELYRTSSSGAVPESLLRTLLQHCEVEAVLKLKVNDGLGLFWSTCVEPGRWRSIRQLNLSHNSMAALPSSIGQLTSLRVLRLSHNKLASLPAELKHLTQLHVLAADHNQLTGVPAELRYLSSLHELHLESNKISRLVLDVSNFSQLQSLQLFSNPVEFLPELSPCSQLRSLSLVNVRVQADARYTRWEVETANLSYMSRTNRLAPFFHLLLRRSSHHHPLLVGALAHMVEIDKANADLLANEPMAVHQLMTMIMSNEPVVVQQACRVVATMAQDVLVAQKFVRSGVLRAMLSLITATRQDAQLGGLHVLSSIAESSEEAAKELLTPAMQSTLQQLMLSPVPAVQQAAVLALSNLAYSHANKIRILNTPSLMRVLEEYANPKAKVASPTRRAALRTLAVLGQNDLVQKALKIPPIKGRGVRVLSMDGGGMKGMAMVETLREIEKRTGKRIHELFDLIAGTSTGAILAVSLGLHRKSLDECKEIYTSLGHKVFNQAGTATREDSTSWTESFMRMYKSGSQSVRIAVYGSKHDASTFETLLKDVCSPENMGLTSDQMIDTAVLGGPKVFVVATLVSITPACPFVFCNYELPPEAVPAASAPTPAFHSSKARVWQAVRASSAAPYFLDEFSCGELRFQDGAATANNPSVVAVQQARLLWPHLPIECFVSLGVGRIPPALRERSVSSYLEVGNVLFESACAVERVDEAMATLLPLVQGPHPAGGGLMRSKYFRFTACDPRCDMDLDDVDPASWAELMQATRDYLEQPATKERLEECCALLNTGLTASTNQADFIRLLPGQGIVLIEAPLAGPLLPENSIEQVAKLVSQLPQMLTRCQLCQTTPPKSPHLTQTPMHTIRSLSFHDTLPSLSGPLTPYSAEHTHLGLLSQYLNNGLVNNTSAVEHKPHHFDGTGTNQSTSYQTSSTGNLEAKSRVNDLLATAVAADATPSRSMLLSPTSTSTPIFSDTGTHMLKDRMTSTSQTQLLSSTDASPPGHFIRTPPHSQPQGITSPLHVRDDASSPVRYSQEDKPSQLPSHLLHDTSSPPCHAHQDVSSPLSHPRQDASSPLSHAKQDTSLAGSPGTTGPISPPTQIPTSRLVPQPGTSVPTVTLTAPPGHLASSPANASPIQSHTIETTSPTSHIEYPTPFTITSATATAAEGTIPSFPAASSPPLSHTSHSPAPLTPPADSPSRSRLSISNFAASEVGPSLLTPDQAGSPACASSTKSASHLTIHLDVGSSNDAAESAGAQARAAQIDGGGSQGKATPATTLVQQESSYQNVLSPTASQETSSIFSYFFSAWQSTTPAPSRTASKLTYSQSYISNTAASQTILEEQATPTPVAAVTPDAADGAMGMTGIVVEATGSVGDGAARERRDEVPGGGSTAGALSAGDDGQVGGERASMAENMMSAFMKPVAGGEESVREHEGGREGAGSGRGDGEGGRDTPPIPSLASLTAPLSRLSHAVSTPAAAVIHLALHPTLPPHPSSSLVLSWQHQLLSTAEPGVEAAALVQQLGGVRGVSLRQMFQTRSVLYGGGMILVLLGIQEVQVTPTAKVRSYLMQKITPKDVLTVQDVQDMGRRGLWHDKSVVVGGRVEEEMADALLGVGCKAVVSGNGDEVEAGMTPGSSVASGFERLYAALGDGKTLQECLEAAESAGHCLVCRTGVKL